MAISMVSGMLGGHEMSTVALESEKASEIAGRHLTFRLGGGLYGLPLLRVLEIACMTHIARAPAMPVFALGCVNLRGKVVPVISLRLKFGMDASSDTESTCILVVQVHFREGAITLGLVVDEVCEVVNLLPGQVGEPPSGEVGGGGAIIGLWTVGENAVRLLDPDRIFTDRELDTLALSQRRAVLL
jgi:purine-binding chemotaxis protein CheW